MIKKKMKKQNKIVLLAKTNLNTIEVLIAKVLIDSYVSHEKIISLIKALKEYDDMKEEPKIFETIDEQELSIY